MWKVTRPDLVWRFKVYRSPTDVSEFSEVGEVGTSPSHGGTFTFLDENVQPQDALSYKILTVQQNGLSFWSEVATTIVPPRRGVLVWKSTNPNPSSERVTFVLDSPLAGRIEIRVFDVRGAEVRMLFRGQAQAGENHYDWDGRNNTGQSVIPGVYFVEVNLGGEQAKKMIVRTQR